MSLISLLVAVLLGSLLLIRWLGATPPSPSGPAQPSPPQRIQGVEKAIDAAGQVQQQRLDDALKGLR
jgi:hypothetical protein